MLTLLFISLLHLINTNAEDSFCFAKIPLKDCIKKKKKNQDQTPQREGGNGKRVGASELLTSFKQDIPKLSNNNKHFVLQIQFSEVLVSFQLKLIGV